MTVDFRDTAVPSGPRWHELANVSSLPEQQIMRIREHLGGTNDDDLVHTQYYGTIAGNLVSSGEEDDNRVERLIIVGQDGAGRELRRTSVDVAPAIFLEDMPAIYLGTSVSAETKQRMPWCVIDGGTGDKRQLWLVCHRIVAAPLFAQWKLAGSGAGVAWQGKRLVAAKAWKDLSEDAFLFDQQLLSTIESNTSGFLRGALADALRSWGISPRRGVLLAGPPGNGKTVITRIMGKRALEAGVNLVVLDAEALDDDLEEQLKLAASRSPVLIVIDDIDLHVGSRPDRPTIDRDAIDEEAYAFMRGGRARERALATFLEFLDGILPREGYALLATTNFRDRLDASLLRAGRFDLIIDVPGPSYEARAALLARFTELPTPGSQLNVVGAAMILEGCSFADLAEVARRHKLAVVFEHGAPTLDQAILDETARAYAVERLNGFTAGELSDGM